MAFVTNFSRRKVCAIPMESYSQVDREESAKAALNTVNFAILKSAAAALQVHCAEDADIDGSDYNTRLRYLGHIEPEYQKICSLLNSVCSRQNEIFTHKINAANIIQVTEGSFNDYYVLAPPLGDVFGGNAAFIMYFTNLALEHANKNGANFRRITDGCIIVKQYCHCEDVAMGTMENREIHCITDTIIKSMRTDDNPWHFNCCYVWCESDNPRTEIIITDKSTAPFYNSYVNATCEETVSGGVGYVLHRSILLHAGCEMGKVLNSFEQFENGESIATDGDLYLALIRLATVLRDVITLLRMPFMNERAHAISHQYSKKRKGAQDFFEDIFSPGNSTCVKSSGVIKMVTRAPYSLRSESGRGLCAEQEHCLRKTMQNECGELSLSSSADLTVTIVRYMDRYKYHAADADNLNVGFLNFCRERVKIIYVRTINRSPDGPCDCEITLSPKSCGFSLK